MQSSLRRSCGQPKHLPKSVLPCLARPVGNNAVLVHGLLNLAASHLPKSVLPFLARPHSWARLFLSEGVADSHTSLREAHSSLLLCCVLQAGQPLCSARDVPHADDAAGCCVLCRPHSSRCPHRASCCLQPGSITLQ